MKDIAMKDLRMIFMALDDWWQKAKQTELLLKLAKKGDRRALRKADRKIEELEKTHGIMQIIGAYQAAIVLKSFIDRPRYRAVFRRSYYYDAFCDNLARGRKGVPSTATV